MKASLLFIFLLLGLNLSASEPTSSPADVLKQLIDQGITTGPEFEKALAATRGTAVQMPESKEVPMAFDKLETTLGKVYEGVKVQRVDPDGLSVFHSAGAKKIPFTELSAELQAIYGFDIKKAEDFQRLQWEAQKKTQEAMHLRKLEQNVQRAEQNVAEAIQASAISIWVEVMQNPGGDYSLCNWGPMVNTPIIDRSGLSAKVRGNRLVSGAKSEKLIAVYGISHLQDGGTWTGTVFPCGNITYQSVGSGPRTIQQFATTVQVASELLSAR